MTFELDLLHKNKSIVVLIQANMLGNCCLTYLTGQPRLMEEDKGQPKRSWSLKSEDQSNVRILFTICLLVYPSFVP